MYQINSAVFVVTAFPDLNVFDFVLLKMKAEDLTSTFIDESIEKKTIKKSGY